MEVDAAIYPACEGAEVSITDHERQELSEAVQIDPHGIEPIPEADRDSTPLQQFWIWAGANIAPINWVLGALGIVLGLSLVETMRRHRRSATSSGCAICSACSA